jgi:hypothetical protein
MGRGCSTNGEKRNTYRLYGRKTREKDSTKKTMM